MTLEEAKKWNALLSVLENSPCPVLEVPPVPLVLDSEIEEDDLVPLAAEPDWISVTLCVICSSFSRNNLGDSAKDLIELITTYLEPNLQGNYAYLIHGDQYANVIEERLLKWTRKVTRLAEVQLTKRFLIGNSKASLEILKRKYKSSWSDRVEPDVDKKVDNTINLKVSLDNGVESNA